MAQAASFEHGLSYDVLATTCSVGAVFLHTTLLDVDGDRRDGKITSGVWLGERRTRVLAAVLATTALAAAGMSSTVLLIVPCALLALLTWFAGSQRISVWGTSLFSLAWIGAVFLSRWAGRIRHSAGVEETQNRRILSARRGEQR